MESLTGLLTVSGWFLLRFGLPIGVTIAVCWMLQKLDRYWQKSIGEGQESVKFGQLTNLLNCWSIKNCSEENKNQCLAFQNPETPCWQHFRLKDGNLQNRCIGCAVFRSTPAPSFGD